MNLNISLQPFPQKIFDSISQNFSLKLTQANTYANISCVIDIKNLYITNCKMGIKNTCSNTTQLDDETMIYMLTTAIAEELKKTPESLQNVVLSDLGLTVEELEDKIVKGFIAECNVYSNSYNSVLIDNLSTMCGLGGKVTVYNTSSAVVNCCFLKLANSLSLLNSDTLQNEKIIETVYSLPLEQFLIFIGIIFISCICLIFMYSYYNNTYVKQTDIISIYPNRKEIKIRKKTDVIR